MKPCGFDWGNLVHWVRDDLGLALDAEFSISDKRARKLLAQIAETRNMYKPLMELVASYGNQIRRILAAHINDAGEMEDVENEFWATVVQIAGKYVENRPVKHWLSVIAKRQAISAYRRLSRRSKFVAYRAEMSSKMRDAGEEDDLDLESLAEKEVVAEYRQLPPDEVLERKQLAKAARRSVEIFLGSLDDETAEAIIRNKVDGITFEAWAKRTGKSGELLRMQISRAYRKMRKRKFRRTCGGLSFMCIGEVIWNTPRSNPRKSPVTIDVGKRRTLSSEAWRRVCRRISKK